MNPEHIVIQIAAMAWMQQVPPRTIRISVRSGGVGAGAVAPKDKIKTSITTPFGYKKTEETINYV